jgi:hypothetical protein
MKICQNCGEPNWSPHPPKKPKCISCKKPLSGPPLNNPRTGDPATGSIGPAVESDDWRDADVKPVHCR